MKRDTEIRLATELLGLHAEKTAFLDESVASSPVRIYQDPERFSRERERVFRTALQPALHSSELEGPGAFLRRDVVGLPVLFTRDAEGVAHAFLNVCRHRGTRLVDAERGCKHRFSCPYHAWTWNNRGELVGVPHEAQGFPELDRSSYGLKRLGCTERYGWLWVRPDSDAAPDVDAGLSGLGPDFDWFNSAGHQLLHTDEMICNANWKILVEGGIEAYHFRVAHKDTIAPYFLDNLSSYEAFGRHMRSILARRTLTELAGQPEDSWRLRDHAQILYSLFPANQLLVQPDHFAWIQLEPLAVDSTRIRMSTLAPREHAVTPEDKAKWERNHRITVTTLTEDFDIGESIQSGITAGANDQLTFGRFEGALAAFNQNVSECL